MYTGLQLCFKDSFYKEGFYRNLFDRFVKFEPKQILNISRVWEWNDKKHSRAIDSYNSNGPFSISGKGSSFYTVISDYIKPFRKIKIVQNIDHFLPSNEEIEHFIDPENFIAGYLYNEDYEEIHSTVSESNLGKREFSPEILATIKNTPYKLNVFGGKLYNTKFNPGSTVIIENVSLMVAWKMWFGEEFFKLIPKAKVLSFPYAEEIRELPNGIVYVQLYDKIETPYTPDNVFKQWKWKEWLDYG